MHWLLRILLGCWVGLLQTAMAAGPAAPSSQTEVVTVGLMADFPPFESWPAQGQPTGLDVELVQRLAQDAGLQIRFQRFVAFEDLLAALRAGRVQLITATAQSAERATYLRFTRPYSSTQQAFVGRGDMTSVPALPDLAGRRLAVVRGHISETIAVERFPMASRPAYQTLNDAVQAVVNGDADFVIELLPTLQVLVDRLPAGPLRVSRTFGFPEGHLRLAAGLADAALIDRLDKALAALDPQVLDGLRQRWLGAAAAPKAPTAPSLPAAVASGVAPLRVGYFPQDRPYSYQGAAGDAEGIGVEMMKAVVARAGLQIDRFVPLQLPELLKALAEGRIDMALGLTDTAPRRRQMAFVGPYRSNPLVLISRQQYSVWSLDQLSHRRLAMLEGFFGEAYIRAAHPTVTIATCPAFDACLDMVESGAVDAAMYGLHGVYERLQPRQSRNLQITGTVGGLFDEHNLGLALKHAALAPALRDALATVMQHDLAGLERGWAQHQAAAKFDWRQVQLAGAGVTGLLLMLLAAWWVHVRRMRRQHVHTLQARGDAERARSQTEAYLAFMAHEVRNSLQAVRGAVTLLHRPRREASQQKQLLDALDQSSQSTLDLLNGMLDRHRLDEGHLHLQLRPEQVGTLLRRLVDELRPAAQAKGLDLQFDPQGADRPLLVDALRLQLIVRNLLVNAIKFTDRGQVRASLQLRASAAGRCAVRLSVQDNGPGVEAAARPHVFDRFYSLGGDRPSTGLGLSLSHDLARSFGGDLTLHSDAGQGARFDLSFEADTATPEPAAARPPLRRVLVVEDSPVYAILLERAFELAGVVVVQADSLAGARQLLGAADAATLDLVLSDAHLPDGHIGQLLAWMDTQRAGGRVLPPALCMSADFMDDEAALGLRRQGAVDTLSKDGDVGAFVQRVLAVVQGVPA